MFDKLPPWNPGAARAWFGLVAGLVAFDQLTKQLVVDRFRYGESLALLPVLDLTRLHNTGAAFSLLADQAGWQRWFFSAIAAAVALALGVILLRLERGTPRPLAASYALIMAGAVGNLIDRLRQGYVVDFVHLHWKDWYYPAFNVADSAITVGALLLIHDALRTPTKS
jgi:signal peptidase II